MVVEEEVHDGVGDWDGEEDGKDPSYPSIIEEEEEDRRRGESENFWEREDSQNATNSSAWRQRGCQLPRSLTKPLLPSQEPNKN